MSSVIFQIKIAGKSMRPFFGDGSSASVVFCTCSDLRLGDIAVFRDLQGFTCHRVTRLISKNGGLFVETKGDASVKSDPAIDGSLILGKIVSRKIGRFSIPVDNFFARKIGLGIGFLYPLSRRAIYNITKALTGIWRTV